MRSYQDLISFILSEKILTITVICSIITFQFISSFKNNITDPIINFMLPEEYFSYLHLVLRDGVEVPKPTPKKLVLDFGQVLRDLVLWMVLIGLVLLMAAYIRFQDTPQGNVMGAAVL